MWAREDLFQASGNLEETCGLSIHVPVATEGHSHVIGVMPCVLAKANRHSRLRTNAPVIS
jgi:hypothetical protein